MTGDFVVSRPERQRLDRVGRIVVDSAIRVHKTLGPGLMESTYQTCVAFELRSAGLDVRTEVVLPIVYRGARIDVGYRVDLLIDGMVIIENKAVERLLRVHTAQILTYLQLSGYKLGFLLNWNVRLMKHGISRIVLDY